MTTRYNLEMKAARLRKDFVALNLKAVTLGTKLEKLSPAQKRSLFITLRNVRRAYDDLRKVEAKLRALP